MAYPAVDEEENPFLVSKPWYYNQPQPVPEPPSFDTQVEETVPVGLPDQFVVEQQPKGDQFIVESQPKVPPENFVVEGQFPKSVEPKEWDDTDKDIWSKLSPQAKKYFLDETNAAKVQEDVKARRDAIAYKEFVPPENWKDLTREQKTAAQEAFYKDKEISLASFDTAEAQKGRGDIVDELRGDVQSGTTPAQAVREQLAGELQADLASPVAGAVDVGAGIANTMAHAEALARGVKPEDTWLHELAGASRDLTTEMVGKRGDEFVPQLLRGMGTSAAFAPSGLGGGAGVALMGAASAFGDGYFEAKEMGRQQGRDVSELEAYSRATFDALVGTTEAVPVFHAMGRLGKPFTKWTPEVIQKMAPKIAGALQVLDGKTGGLISRALAISAEGAEEFAQEYGQDTATDLYDKLTGLSDKSWGEVLGHLDEGSIAGLSGILTGIAMNTTHVAATAAQKRGPVGPRPAGVMPGQETITPPPFPATPPPIPGVSAPGTVTPEVLPPEVATPAGARPVSGVTITPPPIPGTVAPPAEAAAPGAVQPAAAAPTYGGIHPIFGGGTYNEPLTGEVMAVKLGGGSEQLYWNGKPTDRVRRPDGSYDFAKPEELKDPNWAKPEVTRSTLDARIEEGAAAPAGVPPVPGVTITPTPSAEVPASETNPIPQARVEAIDNLLATTTDPAQREALEKEKALINVKQSAGQAVSQVKQAVDNLEASNAPATAKALEQTAAAGLHDAASAVQERMEEITPAGTFKEEEVPAPAAQPAQPVAAAPAVAPGAPAVEAVPPAEAVVRAQAGVQPALGPVAEEALDEVVTPGIKGQEAVIPRPSAQIRQQLAGVKVDVQTISETGEPGVIPQQDAAEALAEAKKDHTAFQLLINCLT